MADTNDNVFPTKEELIEDANRKMVDNKMENYPKGIIHSVTIICI